MSALAIYNAAAISNDLQISLFDDFIAFIDRGEKTTQTYITNLRQFAAWLKYATICRPVRADIIAYREYLTAEHEAIQLDMEAAAGWSYRKDAAGNHIMIKCKPNTIAQYLRCVCQFFKWTASEGLYPNIAENIHAPKVSNEQHKKEALTAKDVLTIEQSILDNTAHKIGYALDVAKDVAIDNASDIATDVSNITLAKIDRLTEQGKRLYAMYLLAVNCGLRTIEISRANIKDIETKNGISFIYIWGKGHTEPDKKKPLAAEVKAAIDDYLNCRTDAKTGNSPLFVSTGNRSGGKRIATTTISTMLKKAMQAAGYDSERLTAHSLRHTTAQNVLEITGENIHQTQQYLRHNSPTTTQIYLRETEQEQRQEADIAQRLYNHYHNMNQEQTAADKLQAFICRMDLEQLEHLTNIAAAMAK